jgi:hypothetical protein
VQKAVLETRKHSTAMAIAFLANGHVQVTALKKGTGDRFFSTSKWQKRYLDVDPESGVLEYSDKPGGAPRGTFTVRNAIVTLPSASEEGTHVHSVAGF